MLQTINFNSFPWPQSVLQSPSFQINFLPSSHQLRFSTLCNNWQSLKSPSFLFVRVCVDSELEFRSSLIKMGFSVDKCRNSGRAVCAKQSIKVFGCETWTEMSGWKPGLWESNQSNKSNTAYTYWGVYFIPPKIFTTFVPCRVGTRGVTIHSAHKTWRTVNKTSLRLTSLPMPKEKVESCFLSFHKQSKMLIVFH